MSTVRSAGFALFCALAAVVILVPAVRAQRTAPAADAKALDARSVAQRKINAHVLSAIYGRRGDLQRKAIAANAAPVPVDRHGRALVDVRAQVRPELQKKMKALGGIVVSTSTTYDSTIAWMPLQTLERLAADTSVRAIEPGPTQ